MNPLMNRRSCGSFCLLAVLAVTGACAPASDAESERSLEPALQEAPGSILSQTADGPSGAKLPPDHTFRTLDGEDITFADFAGEVAVVNLWGTWCLPCRRELPELVELAETYADRDVRIIGIAVDSGDPDDIRTFLADFGVEYSIWLTEMDTAIGKYGAVGFPFTLIVDRDGWIRKEYLGPQTVETLSADIDALLQ